MKLFNNTLFLSLIFLILISACNSPTEVPANRIVTKDNTLEKEYGFKELQINTHELRFLDVPYESSQALYFKIYNHSSKAITIENISSVKHKDLFTVVSPSIPFILGAKDKDSSSREVFIKFSAQKIGEFWDTLVINDLVQPRLRLYAAVPVVDVSDADFGFQKVGQSKVKPPIYIFNHSDKSAIIRDFKMIDPEGVFELLTSLPLEILPKTRQGLIIRFSPKEEKPYNGRIEFIIDGVPGYIDNTAQMTGSGLQ